MVAAAVVSHPTLDLPQSVRLESRRGLGGPGGGKVDAEKQPSEEPTDPELLVAFQRGDRDAFAELYREYFPRHVGQNRRRGLSQESAEEVAQDAWVRIFRFAAKFDDAKASFSTWTYQINANCCWSYLEREKQRAAIQVLEELDYGSEETRPRAVDALRLFDDDSWDWLEIVLGDDVNALIVKRHAVLRAAGESVKDSDRQVGEALDTNPYVVRGRRERAFRKLFAALPVICGRVRYAGSGSPAPDRRVRVDRLRPIQREPESLGGPADEPLNRQTTKVGCFVFESLEPARYIVAAEGVDPPQRVLLGDLKAGDIEGLAARADFEIQPGGQR